MDYNLFKKIVNLDISGSKYFNSQTSFLYLNATIFVDIWCEIRASRDHRLSLDLLG